MKATRSACWSRPSLLGCSGLDEGEAGVVGIEVSVPGPDTRRGRANRSSSRARPLDKNGDSVGTPVTWVSADPTATIDAATGVLTGVSAGSARVQATVGALGSELITFAVVAPADTLVARGRLHLHRWPAGARRPRRRSPPGSTASIPPGRARRPRRDLRASPRPTRPPARRPSSCRAAWSPTRCRPAPTATPRPPSSWSTGADPARQRHRRPSAPSGPAGAVVPGSGQRFIIRFTAP